MARGQKGAGSVFQRTYRDAHGRKKSTKNWYIEYGVGGRTIRGATEYTKRSDAIEFLKKRVADALKRKGFFELDQFRAILKHLPTGYHPRDIDETNPGDVSRQHRQDSSVRLPCQFAARVAVANSIELRNS